MNNAFLHKAFALLLTFILLAYNIKTISIIVNFKINQYLIARTLCVQKEDQKGCLGKCQLVKALKKDSQTNNQNPIQNNKIISLNITYLQPITKIDFNFFHKIKSNHIYNDFKQKKILKCYEILTPPPKNC